MAILSKRDNIVEITYHINVVNKCLHILFEALDEGNNSKSRTTTAKMLVFPDSIQLGAGCAICIASVGVEYMVENEVFAIEDESMLKMRETIESAWA